MKFCFVQVVFLMIVNAFFPPAGLFCQNQPTQFIASASSDRQFFIENKGQWPSDVLFLARLQGVDVWITKNGVNYTHYTKEKIISTSGEASWPPNKLEMKDEDIKGHRILVNYSESNENAHAIAKEKLEGYLNYFIGRDSSRYATHVGRYKEVSVLNIYDGIDVRYYLNQGMLRYDFIVHPGSDPSQIKLQIAGADTTKLTENELELTTVLGKVRHKDLQAYQTYNNTRHQVQTQWQQSEDFYSYSIGAYNNSELLIIDPLVYFTYIGGWYTEYCSDLKLSADNHPTIIGCVDGSDYDITPGAFQTIVEPIYQNIFVTKFNSNGSALEFSTYLGGSLIEFSNTLAIDDDDHIYLTGHTESPDFPCTQGAYQSNMDGAFDVFISKLKSDGTMLLYSTLLGGSDNEWSNKLVLNNNGNAYIAGSTWSNNFDITSGAYQETKMLFSDIFVTQLNSDGTGLVYSTYIGGSFYDYANDICIDTNGNAYITGYSESNDYPLTTNALDTLYGNINIKRDAIITILNHSGNELIYSSFYGDTDYNETGMNINIGLTGKIFISGYRYLGNNINPPTSDYFVVCYNLDVPDIIYASILGSNVGVSLEDQELDFFDNIYLYGSTRSTNFPVTTTGYQISNAGETDKYITKVNDSGIIVYSTYFGGNMEDAGGGLEIDTNGNAYLAGHTSSDNFIFQNTPYQPINEGVLDAFVAKLCFAPDFVNLSMGNNNQTLCVNNPITPIIFSLEGVDDIAINGLPNGVVGQNADSIYIIQGTPLLSGNYPYTFYIVNHCGLTQAVAGTLFVLPCTTSVAENQLDISIDFYPNPASSAFSFRISEQQHTGGTLHISDVNGRQVASHHITQSNQTISSESLAPGLYALAYEHHGRILWRGKLCVMR